MKRLGRGLALSLLATTVLLTGCTGQDHDTADTSSEEKGASRPDAAPRNPPAAEAPNSSDDRKAESSEEEREAAPKPDYLSTFALDVDTASYGYARRSLREGQLPEPETVRPEEFVNSFRQDYRRPEGNGFSVTTDGASTGDSGWSLMRVGLATQEDTRTESRPPAVLTFVIDISGSMSQTGRLDLVRKSLTMMVGQLRDDDSVSLVTFSDQAETLIPATRLGDEGQRSKVRGAIDDLETADSTNLGAGLTRGYEEAVEGRQKGATNRVVVLSDALANTGDVDADTLLERIGDARSEHGITLFGVGVGSEYGDELMEELTNQGDGHTAYVSTEDEAREVFVEQLPRNIEVRARDAKAQVAFEPETVEEFRLIGYENRAVADEDFRDDRVDGGEVGPGHTVTALYAVRLKEGAQGQVATATVRWLDPKTREPNEKAGTVDAAALTEDLWSGSPRLQLAAVSAYFADTLRTWLDSERDSADPGTRTDSDGETGRDTGADEKRAEPLPDLPSLRTLEDRAREIADETGDGEVTQLAEAIADARTLEG